MPLVLFAATRGRIGPLGRRLPSQNARPPLKTGGGQPPVLERLGPRKSERPQPRLRGIYLNMKAQITIPTRAISRSASSQITICDHF
jgi:hypothetical protein